MLESIVKFIFDQSRPASIEIGSEKHWIDFIKNLRTNTIVAFYDQYSSNNGREYMAVAQSLKKEYKFAHLTTITDETLGYFGKIVLFQPLRQNFDDHVLIYEHDVLKGKNYFH